MNKKDAMKEVMNLIDEKAKRRKELRDGSQQDATHVQEVLKFLNNLDLLTSEAQNEIDFYVGMERECNMLKHRLKSFDPYAKALVEWNDTKDWKQLHPIGVRIYWSKYHIRLNPDCDEEEYIDVGRLLLDDYE
jgi:hypothetical protein